MDQTLDSIVRGVVKKCTNEDVGTTTQKILSFFEQQGIQDMSALGEFQLDDLEAVLRKFSREGENNVLDVPLRAVPNLRVELSSYLNSVGINPVAKSTQLNLKMAESNKNDGVSDMILEDLETAQTQAGSPTEDKAREAKMGMNGKDVNNEEASYVVIDQELLVRSSYVNFTCKKNLFLLQHPHIPTKTTSITSHQLSTASVSENSDVNDTGGNKPRLKKSKEKRKQQETELVSPLLDSNSRILLDGNTDSSTHSTSVIDSRSVKRQQRKNETPQRTAQSLLLFTAAEKEHNYIQIIQADYAKFLSQNSRDKSSCTDALEEQVEVDDIDFTAWCDTACAMQKFIDKRSTIVKLSSVVSHQLPSSPLAQVTPVEISIDHSLLFNTIVCNNFSTELILTGCQAKFLVPSNSRFLMSDISQIELLLEDKPKRNSGAENLVEQCAYITKNKGEITESGFDLIVIDPPWENRSVHRGNKYKTLPNYKFFELPIPQLVNHKRCIVAVWVTNKHKFVEFVKNALFPYWKIKYVNSWHWLKVTNNGELTVPIDSPHKKPFESIVLGIACNADSDNSFGAALSTHKTIISTPGKHSRKPIIKELFAPYLPTEPFCLELFARNLQAGWTSWGNEVLKFQNLKYFEANANPPT